MRTSGILVALLYGVILHEMLHNHTRRQPLLQSFGLVASGQVTMREVDGWQTLDKLIQPMTLDLAA